MPKKLEYVKGFVSDINETRNHVILMFLPDYNANYYDDHAYGPKKIVDWDKVEKQRIIREIDAIRHTLSLENPDEYIRTPLSECRKYITLKYSKYCKCYGLDENPISVSELKGHIVKAFIKVSKYDFENKDDGKKVIGVYIPTNKLMLFEL